MQAQLLQEPWLQVTSIKALVKGVYSEAYRVKVLEARKGATGLEWENEDGLEEVLRQV